MQEVLANPFSFIKLRYYIVWVVCSLPLLIISLLVFNYKDDTVNAIFGAWFHFVAILWIAFMFRRHHASIRKILGRFPKISSLFGYIGITILLIFCSFGSIFVAIAALFTFFPHLLQYLSQNAISSHPHTTTPQLYLVVNIFFLIILAPIVEELFFRGVMLHRFTTKWGIKRGVIFSSAIFAILHQNENILGIFVFGIILSLIYLKTKSLFATIFCHMVNNSLFSIFFIFDFMSKPTNDKTTSKDIPSLLILGIVLLALTLPILFTIVRRYWKQNATEFAVLPYFANQETNREIAEVLSISHNGI